MLRAKFYTRLTSTFNARFQNVCSLLAQSELKCFNLRRILSKCKKRPKTFHASDPSEDMLLTYEDAVYKAFSIMLS